jgi:hypothetical protein
MSQIMTDVVIRKTFIDGPDILTWFDLHTKVTEIRCRSPTGATSRTARSARSRSPSIRGRSLPALAVEPARGLPRDLHIPAGEAVAARRSPVPADYEKIRAENITRYGTDTAALDLLGQLYSDRTHFIFELIQNAEDLTAGTGV